MAKDPAFLFYHHDFIVGVAFMSLEERGAYITILCYMADKGYLSLGQIKAICGTFDPTALLEEKFKIDENGNYYHHRLLYEVERRKSFTESRKKGAYAKHMHMLMVNENRNENIIDNIKTKHLDCVELSIGEYAKLVEKFGEKGAKDRIDELNTGIMSKGYKYKSHYHAILAWDKRRSTDEVKKPLTQNPEKRYQETKEYLKKLENGEL